MSALVLVLLLVGTADAARGASTGASANVVVQLVSEMVTVQPGQPFYVGLRMRMRKGWHTYWKNPGDAGLPLRIEWNLPEGFSAGPIEWPAPERIPTGSLMSYGYSREVFLPIEITPPHRIGADSIAIAGAFEWLECKEACLSSSSALDLTLPVESESPVPGPAAPLFAGVRVRMPGPPTSWDLSAEAGPRAVSLAFRVPPGVSPREAYFFVDQPLVAEYAAPQAFERTRDGYRLTMRPAPNASGPPPRLTGVLVLDARAGSRKRTALEVDIPVSQGDPVPAREPPKHRGPPPTSYAIVLGLAALGLTLYLRRTRGRSAGMRPR